MDARREKSQRKGTALIVVMVTFIATFSFSAASVMISQATLQNAQYNAAKLKSIYVAQAGLESAIAEFKRRSVLSQGSWEVLDNLVEKESFFQDIEFSSEGIRMGTYDVDIDLESTEEKERVYRIVSRGTVSRGQQDAYVRTTVSASVHFRFDKTSAFQFGYFMNHFGWMYSSSNWVFNGNMGAAGVFNWYSSPLQVNGTPQYKSYDSDTNTLSDPVFHTPKDGSESKGQVIGGTLSGFDIIGSGNLTGNPSETYPFQPMLNIPILNESYFNQRREEAYANQNYIKIGENYVCDGVYGDQAGPTDADWLSTLISAGYIPQNEVATGNLYLEGTDENPVELNGSVVIEGNLFIKGKVTGRGALSVRGNVYIGDSLEYVNEITSPQNATDKDSIESWIDQNRNKDGLGIYTKGAVGAGDYSTYISHSLVRNWLEEEPANESAEALNGFDGMPGTGDLGEDDPDWNVQYYTSEDENLGRIPDGFSVGDPVPGTGEDFDGDAKNDPRLRQSDLRPRGGEDMEDEHREYENINSEFWGNAPGSTATPSPLDPPSPNYKLRNLTTKNVNRIDAAIFTSKLYLSWITNSGGLDWNGSLISRLEAAIAPSRFFINFDRRLMGGGGNLGFDLPDVWQSVIVNNYQMEVQNFQQN